MKKLTQRLIKLPEDLNKWIDRRVEGDGEFASVSDYFRTIVREDRANRRAYDEMRSGVLEGLVQAEQGVFLTEKQVFDPLAKRAKKR